MLSSKVMSPVVMGDRSLVLQCTFNFVESVLFRLGTMESGKMSKFAVFWIMFVWAVFFDRCGVQQIGRICVDPELKAFLWQVHAVGQFHTIHNEVKAIFKSVLTVPQQTRHEPF